MTTARYSFVRPAMLRAVGWLTVGAMLAIAVLGPSAPRTLAASVTPVVIDVTSNMTCGDFDVSHGGGQTWLEVKSDPNADGVITVEGFGTITISGTTDDKTFDWVSTFGIDAVYVKAGQGGSNLYVYAATAEATESTGDTDLTSPGEGTTNQISHISFCYDANNPTPSSAPPSEEPSTPPSEAPSTPPSESPSFSGGVEEETGTPAVTLPPTDGIAGQAGPASDGWRMALVALAAIVASALILTPARSTRRR